MRVYISGKVTGLFRMDYAPKFAAARSAVADRGHDPCCPVHDINHPQADRSREAIVRRCLAALLACDAILMLHDWRDSPGAREELELALKIGIPVFYSPASIPNKQTSK